jgi:serine palmitoyltransferase
MRINDCFSRPVTGVPGRKITLLERFTDDYCKTFHLTGNTVDCLNLSSYNYLGFAQCDGPCADAVEKTVKKYGISSISPRAEVGMQNCHVSWEGLRNENNSTIAANRIVCQSHQRFIKGTLDIHQEVEELVARFVGKPAAMVVSMGYATNSTTLPALVSKGSLIISDEMNHSSIVFGSRLSGAFIRVYKHNDMEDLENLLKECISQGQPRTRRPWKKVLLVVEGLYSMEGSICNLPKIIELKKKYKVGCEEPFEHLSYRRSSEPTMLVCFVTILLRRSSLHLLQPFVHTHSFICMSTRHIASALWVRVVAVCVITTVSTPWKLTYLWGHSPSRLAQQVATLLPIAI